MTHLSEPPVKFIHVNDTYPIPLYGLDFLGILDRGTNVLEIKPITLCNLHCRYCFVKAGDYDINFVADVDYLIKWLKKAVKAKQCDDLEIHLAPYGEIFLYKEVFALIREIRKIPEVKIISLQSNGLLLTNEKIQQLEDAGLDRLNLSLNSMDEAKCSYYCDVPHYDLPHLLNMFDRILASSMDLLIAPVWFKGVNDKGIDDIIAYVKQKEHEGFSWPKLRLGIQNYLTYRTGRKIRKAHQREFGYYYKILRQMEKQHHLKLKLGPNDFGIHRTGAIFPPVKLNDIDTVEIMMMGRWKNEFIARLNDEWAVKVLSDIHLEVGKRLSVKFIKSSLRGNLLTAIPAKKRR
ncbi:MAG: radical SAM protein [Promethearchaeota archaeon]